MSCVVTIAIAPAFLASASRLAQRRARCLVEAGERFVEEQEARRMYERALEREPLPHATREGRDRLPGAVLQRSARQRGRHHAIDIRDAIEPREERKVFSGRQLGVEIQLVSEDPDPAAQRGPASRAVRGAVEDVASGWCKKRRRDGEAALTFRRRSRRAARPLLRRRIGTSHGAERAGGRSAASRR